MEIFENQPATPPGRSRVYARILTEGMISQGDQFTPAGYPSGARTPAIRSHTASAAAMS